MNSFVSLKSVCPVLESPWNGSLIAEASQCASASLLQSQLNVFIGSASWSSSAADCENKSCGP